MNASVTESTAAVPVLDAIAVVTSAAVHVPWASTPAASAAAKASAKRLAAAAGVECRRVRVVTLVRAAGAGEGKPG